MLKWIIDFWRHDAEQWRHRALAAEIEAERLYVIIQHHHAVDAVHARCGNEAIAREWGRSCDVCRTDGHLGLTATQDEFETEPTEGIQTTSNLVWCPLCRDQHAENAPHFAYATEDESE